MKKTLPFFITLILWPRLAFAAGLMDFVDRSYELITGYLIPLAFLLCLLYFFWGVAKYIRSINPGQKEEGKSVMIWGIVGLFVASSVWGLVILLRSELGIPNTQNPGANSAPANFGTTESVDSVFKPQSPNDGYNYIN